MGQEKDLSFMQGVTAYFLSTRNEQQPEGSLRKTAGHFGLTRTKVQKILVTMGEYETETTRAVQKLFEEGAGQEEIAKRLEISRAAVSASLPYSKTLYGSSDPSEHAAAVRGYRAYQKSLLFLRMQQKEREKEERPILPGEPAVQEKGNRVRTMKKEKSVREQSAGRSGSMCCRRA